MPSPEVLPDPGIEPTPPTFPALAGRFFTSAPIGKPGGTKYISLFFQLGICFCSAFFVLPSSSELNLKECGSQPEGIGQRHGQGGVCVCVCVCRFCPPTPKRHLAVSRDIFDCHNSGSATGSLWHLVGIGQRCLQISCIHRAAPHNKELSFPKVGSTEAKESFSKLCTLLERQNNSIVGYTRIYIRVFIYKMNIVL